jgi:hypothetical protein
MREREKYKNITKKMMSVWLREQTFIIDRLSGAPTFHSPGVLYYKNN